MTPNLPFTLVDLRRVEPSSLVVLLQDLPTDTHLVVSEQQWPMLGGRAGMVWPEPEDVQEWTEIYEDASLQVLQDRLGASGWVVLGTSGERLRGSVAQNAAVAGRTQLAIVSPLPPERSGISDYVAALAPALSRYYDLVLIHPEPKRVAPVNDGRGQAVPLYPPMWLDECANQNCRILYHIGNSPFHEPMLLLMRRHPGIVVLHDYYLSHLVNGWCHGGNGAPDLLSLLQQGHGYPAVMLYNKRFQGDGQEHLWRYSLNQTVLQAARGILIHSPHSRSLAEHDYNPATLHNWHQIPMLCRAAHTVTTESKVAMRQRYSLKQEDQVICSFGYIGPSKLSLELIKAFAESGLARQGWKLIFVGSEGGNSAYRAEMDAAISSASIQDRVIVTGWINAEDYSYLQQMGAIHVQLRTRSRGETSAAVMDCLQSGAALVVNRHGSFDDLPDTVCHKIPDSFSQKQLAEALVRLSKDPAEREQLGQRASEYCKARHAPHVCAQAYHEAIETIHKRGGHPLDVARKLGEASPYRQLPRGRRLAIINGLAARLPSQPAPRRLYVDVSAITVENLGTGIQRVTTNLCREMMSQLPPGWLLEPIRATASEVGYRTAPEFGEWMLGLPTGHLNKPEPVLPGADDLFLGLDLFHAVVNTHTDWYSHIKARGTKTWFVVYDLLPCQLPEFFPPGTDEMHARWLQTVARATGAVCISKTVANELNTWIANHGISSCEVRWFHQGANPIETDPSRLPPKLPRWLKAEAIRSSLELLMVGTIEPRKGYLQVLEAMELLWREKVDLNLKIVGREGWRQLPKEHRRTIPETLDLINSLCKQYPERLKWLKDADDRQLQKSYQEADALIAASYGEGFGLPLVEARHNGLDVIARDLPVFREVMGEECRYFSASNSSQLASFLKEWAVKQSEKPGQSLESIRAKKREALKSNMQTWSESCGQLLKAIGVTKQKSELSNL